MSEAVAIAILAAGRATRFGGGKLDAVCAGKPLGRWVVDAVAAAGLPPGMLVVGTDPPAFAQDAMAEGWALLTNPHAEDGMGGSIALAADHADCLRAEALLLLLADMPLIEADHIARLASHRPLTHPLATAYPNGRPGVPARFPATMFEQLIALDGDRGASALLLGRADVDIMACPPLCLLDVDTPEALGDAEIRLRRGDI